MRAIEKKVFFFVRQGCLFPWDSGGQKKRVHIKAMYGKGGGGSLLGPCLLKSLGVTLLARVTLLISRSQALSCCFDVATSIRHGMVIYAAPSKIADVFWYVRHSSVLRASGSHPVPGRNKEALKLRHGGGGHFRRNNSPHRPSRGRLPTLHKKNCKYISCEFDEFKGRLSSLQAA